VKKKLKIKLHNGNTWTVEAEIIGSLGVHPMRLREDHFTITHVPTTLSFNSVLPETFKTDRGALIKLAGILMKSLPKKDWAALDKLTYEDVMERPKSNHALRDKLRKAILKEVE